MNEQINKDIYEKLTPQRKQIVDMVLENLENGTGLWKQGWRGSKVPESAISGKKYRGTNNLFLSLVSMFRGYSDNRWVTYNQMQANDWKFKEKDDGTSAGKGQGVPVEYYELRDRSTKKAFDKSLIADLSREEQQEYIEENVYPLRKHYVVFNGDLIEGISKQEENILDESKPNDRTENLLDYWDNNQSKIIYGGQESFYMPKDDTIHLPQRKAFYTLQDFYSTALHEMGHSTGHESRLNREILNGFGTEKYAEEELKAEIASMFLQQEMGVESSDLNIENNSAYIKAWKESILENPNALFEAISEAEKITKYVVEKEKENQYEFYAISKEENELGDVVYKAYFASEFGQLVPAIMGTTFNEREEVKKGLEEFYDVPAYKGKEFKEVTMDELLNISKSKAEQNSIKAEQSKEYQLPSSLVAKAMPKSKSVDMAERGIDSLKRMDDRDIVNKACMTKQGGKFNQLYNGISILGNEEKDERSLMTRIAMFCKNDKDQLLRIFKSSGQFHDEKPNSYYDKIAVESMAFINKINKVDKADKTFVSGNKKESFGINSKK